VFPLLFGLHFRRADVAAVVACHRPDLDRPGVLTDMPS